MLKDAYYRAVRGWFLSATLTKDQALRGSQQLFAGRNM
jgi:hypothetical protein